MLECDLEACTYNGEGHLHVALDAAAQIAFDLAPAYWKVVSTPDATRVLYLAAANEDTGATAWQFLQDFCPQLVRTHGAIA